MYFSYVVIQCWTKCKWITYKRSFRYCLHIIFNIHRELRHFGKHCYSLLKEMHSNSINISRYCMTANKPSYHIRPVFWKISYSIREKKHIIPPEFSQDAADASSDMSRAVRGRSRRVLVPKRLKYSFKHFYRGLKYSQIFAIRRQLWKQS